MSFFDKLLGLSKKQSAHQPDETDETEIIPQPPDDLTVVQEKESNQNIQSEDSPQNKSSP